MTEHPVPENGHPVEPHVRKPTALSRDSARENTGEPELTVVVPDEPPLLTPLAAEALLRLVNHVAAQRGDEAQVVPMPARNEGDDDKDRRKAA